MGYNQQFEDKMDTINNIAKGYGFKNGIDWANSARRNGELDYGTFKKYENAHNLRVRFSHGNACDIDISYQTYQLVCQWESAINYSCLRKNGGYKKDVKLPDGVFRGRPYVKEFVRTSKDGEKYYFKFSVYLENNYLDDGYGGTRGYGYFIHIDEAPYFSYAADRLHEFHIIRTPNDFHICWNQIISQFDQANAVMYVWVNRYADLIDVIKSDRSISESELNSKANKKHVLPVGTFRYKRKTIYMYQTVYDEIVSVLGKKKPELGGMLGFSLDQDTIDTYVFDAGARVNSVEYNPNIEYLQKIIDGEWEEKGIFLAGFIHSHPGDFNQLSYADVQYAKEIIEAFDMDYLFMPIVTSSYAYRTSVTGYIVNKNGRVEKCDIQVVSGEKRQIKQNTKNEADDSSGYDSDLLKSILDTFDKMGKEDKIIKNETLSQNDTFARISNVIDIPYMNSCSIIGIGCGGARSFYESMARIGVGNFFLMDGDKASYSNIASQNGYVSEVGLFKPGLIKKRLLDINPDVNVTCFNRMLDNTFTDEILEKTIVSKIDSKRAVICAFTDDFYAQARISRIALKYRIPFICGQHHVNGTTSELVYWYPGVTKYSLREIARSRYESYQNGYVNDVTSVGSPIFNTTRLNALCEKIATGMLLYGYDKNHKYCRFLIEKSDYNLILVKQMYLSEQHPFFDVFNNGINDFFDEVAWVNPESFEDLEDISLEEGKVVDTRDIFGTIVVKDEKTGM